MGKAHDFLSAMTGTNGSGDDYWQQNAGVGPPPPRVCLSEEMMSFSQSIGNYHGSTHHNINHDLPYTTSAGSASGSGSSPGISAGSGSIVGIDAAGMICTGSGGGVGVVGGGYSGNMPINYLEACMHYERPIPIVPPPPPPQMHSEDEIEPAYATGS